jgi:hypothetical protein
MRPLNQGLLWTASWIFALGCSASVLAQDAQRPDLSGQASIAQAQPSRADADSTLNTTELPDSAGATFAKLQETPQPQSNSTQAPAPGSSQASTQDNGAQEQKQDQEQKQEKLQRPVGTATAPAPAVSGITAAQPAGVAIAPAKQHRVRTIILRTGAILGAAAAVGTVVALTEATPSKPPGAH